MSLARVLPPDSDIRPHVLEPLDSSLFNGEAGAAEVRAKAAAQGDWSEAYQRGLADGKRQTEEMLLGAAQALVEAIRQVQADYRRSREDMKQSVLRLSLAIARQVVMYELRTSPEAIAEVVSRLIEEAEDKHVQALRLNPQDATRLAGTPAAKALEQAGVQVQVSDEISPGGCILETEFGRLDARLETRLQEIAATLLGSEKHERATDVLPESGAGETCT